MNRVVITLAFLGSIAFSPVVAQDVEATREIALNFVNGYWNREDLSVVENLLADEAIMYGPSNRFEGKRYTSAEARNVRQSFRRLFPDLRYEVEDVIVEGNKAMVRATARFTHTQEVPTPFGAATPTGEEVTYAIIFVFEVEEGRIVRGWDLYDAMARYDQMGVLPAE